MQKRAWSFQWVGGGYNSVFASTRDEALTLAKEIGKPYEYKRGHMTKGLMVAEDTLTDCPKVMERLDNAYRGCLD